MPYIFSTFSRTDVPSGDLHFMLQVQELVDLPTRRTGLSAAIGELQLDSGLSESITCILVIV